MRHRDDCKLASFFCSYAHIIRERSSAKQTKLGAKNLFLYQKQCTLHMYYRGKTSQVTATILLHLILVLSLSYYFILLAHKLLTKSNPPSAGPLVLLLLGISIYSPRTCVKACNVCVYIRRWAPHSLLLSPVFSRVTWVCK